MPEYLVTVRQDEEGLFIRIPPGLADQLDMRPGERPTLDAVDGVMRLAKARRDLDQDDQVMLRAFEEIREQYDDTLRRLADS